MPARSRPLAKGALQPTRIGAEDHEGFLLHRLLFYGR